MEQNQKTLFAVYGTLKGAYGNHSLLENTSKYLGVIKTPANYTLFDGGFPVVERGGDTSIECELYETEDNATISRVFSLEGCHKEQNHPDSWYTYDKIKTEHGEAIMFVMNKGTSKRSVVIDTGVWGKTRNA